MARDGSRRDGRLTRAATHAREFGRERHWATSARLRQRRLQLGLTQSQVVERLASLGLSITDGALSNMEKGQGVDVAKLPEFARALECTITYLLGFAEDPRAWEPDSWPGTLPERVRPRTRTATPSGDTASATPAGGKRPDGHRIWILGPWPVA